MDSWYLAQEVVKLLREHQRDWVSLLENQSESGDGQFYPQRCLASANRADRTAHSGGELGEADSGFGLQTDSSCYLQRVGFMPTFRQACPEHRRRAQGESSKRRHARPTRTIREVCS